MKTLLLTSTLAAIGTAYLLIANPGSVNQQSVSDAQQRITSAVADAQASWQEQLSIWRITR